MTDTPNPNDHDPTTGDSESGPASEGSKPTAATALLDSIRDAFDDIAVRATPAVREVSARAAELTADVAGRAAPYAKRAGDATADASAKLAERSKTWAAGVRAAMDEEAAKHPEGEGPASWGDAPTTTAGPAPEATNGSNGAHGADGSAPADAGDAPTTEH